MPQFSAKSERKLLECDHQIQKLFRAVVIHQDCTVLTGYRGQMEQDEFFRTKRSKVKWPDGKHNSRPSKAIDIAPYPIPHKWGEEHWKDMVKFYEFAAIVRYEAKRLGIKIRWGGDWDGDGDYRDQKFDDLVHFELVD